MSYGVRNTLILLVVLTLFVGSGWSYIYFYQQPEITRLQREVEQSRQELNNKRQIAERFPQLQNRFEQSRKFFNNYPKALYESSNEDNVFEFLNNINSGSAFTDFTFSFSDSTANGQFGTMTMQVAGEGYYRNVNNFVRQIELNKPLNKISMVTINPINELDSYGMVNFNFTLTSYYDRVKLLGDPELTIANNLLGSLHNPFFPLIRSIPDNENNLVNIEQSTLLAVSGNRIFILDQSGTMQKLFEGDEVYLGELASINVNNGSAIFRLNKGGIIERVTMQVNNDGKQSSN